MIGKVIRNKTYDYEKGIGYHKKRRITHVYSQSFVNSDGVEVMLARLKDNNWYVIALRPSDDERTTDMNFGRFTDALVAYQLIRS